MNHDGLSLVEREKYRVIMVLLLSALAILIFSGCTANTGDVDANQSISTVVPSPQVDPIRHIPLSTSFENSLMFEGVRYFAIRQQSAFDTPDRTRQNIVEFEDGTVAALTLVGFARDVILRSGDPIDYGVVGAYIDDRGQEDLVYVFTESSLTGVDRAENAAGFWSTWVPSR